MFRSLIKLYFIVFLVAALAVFVASKTFIRIFHETITAGQSEKSKGYRFVLREYFSRYQEGGTDNALRRLNENSNEEFSLTNLSEVSGLSKNQKLDLSEGKVIMLDSGEDFYFAINSKDILHARFDGIYFLYLKILGFTVVVAIGLLPILAWSWMLWRDLEILKGAASSFGGGDLSTRTHLRNGSDALQLAKQFNAMAASIEKSMKNNRDMMNGISHELKTPIARLEFGIELLRLPMKDDQRGIRLNALGRDVREMDELVSELLSFSRLDQGAMPLALLRVTIREWIDSVGASVADDVSVRNLSIVFHVDDALKEFIFDPRLVTRALHNLIRNAVRYAETMIAVTVSRGSVGEMMLTVEDNGPGIPSSEQERIFEPFYRLDASRDRHTGGSGLGLAIVRGVALVHGGNVRLTTRPGGGARFIMWLPCIASVGS